MQLQLAERFGGMDKWGAQIMDPHYGAAWAWAGNTPFKWGKQVGSHLGGTRNPMAIRWPERITDTGGLRSQFGHVIDVAPDDPRHRGHPAAADGRRDRAGADARHLDRRHVRRRERAGVPNAAVLRNDRQPGHVQGRLVARDEDRAHPVGRHTGRIEAVCAGRLGSGCGSGRALLPAGRLHAGPRSGRRAPGQGAGAEGPVLGGGREVQGAAVAGHPVHVLRHPAAHRRRSRRSSSAATCRTCSPG